LLSELYRYLGLEIITQKLHFQLLVEKLRGRCAAECFYGFRIRGCDETARSLLKVIVGSGNRQGTLVSRDAPKLAIPPPDGVY
jgi:hypothetical protein